MTTTIMSITRWRLILDYEKEERWLNQMAAEGWAMTSYLLGRYEFAPCTPGAYTFRIELLEWRKGGRKHREDYLAFLEEAGVEVIKAWGNWVYLRKRTEDGPFDLYTDAQSRIGYYWRMAATYGFFGFIASINPAIQLARMEAFGALRAVLLIVVVALGVLMESFAVRYWLRARRLRRDMDVVE